MEPDAIDIDKVQDTSVYDFKGKRTPVRRYTFYIGTHGPFTEDVPLENFDEQEIGRRIAKLKTHFQIIGA